MKNRQKAPRLVAALICCLMLACAIQAQSPFSIDTTTDIDVSVSEDSQEQLTDSENEAIEKIGWVRNDMGVSKGNFVIISKSTVNVRSGPGTGFSILQTAGKNDRYPLIREESGWYAMRIGFIDLEEMAQAWLRNDMAVRVKKIISVTKDKVNLRSGPSTNHSVIGKTTVGRTYPLVESKSNWYRIALMSTDQLIPRSDPQELHAAQIRFTDAYGDYTRLVREKGRSHSDTRKALDRFRAYYGIYSILAKGSKELQNVRSTGVVDRVVIDKKNFTSTLYSNGKIVRIYPIAYGANPDGANKQKVGDKRTPEGAFEIVNQAKNPRYKNIPGGAENNPLGTRWMGLNTWSGSIGMHGTSNPGSIGSRASAGCVRMFTPDAEELFDMVRVSLPVIITSVDGYDHPEPVREEPAKTTFETEEVETEEPDNEVADETIEQQEPFEAEQENNSDSTPVKTDEKPEGFWNRIRSFFGNLFS
jgi:lipoprotein-anchoring transpeptidase ErfK/SrfK